MHKVLCPASFFIVTLIPCLFPAKKCLSFVFATLYGFGICSGSFPALSIASAGARYFWLFVATDSSNLPREWWDCVVCTFSFKTNLVQSNWAFEFIAVGCCGLYACHFDFRSAISLLSNHWLLQTCSTCTMLLIVVFWYGKQRASFSLGQKILILFARKPAKKLFGRRLIYLASGLQEISNTLSVPI